MERFTDAKLNVLLSYGLKNKNMFRFIKQYRSRINSLILDSGAFTLNMAKNKSTRNKIDFMGYRDFLKRFANDFDFVFNYDANFEECGIYENDFYMEKIKADGVSNVVPVVHSYKDYEMEMYIEQGHKTIALGFSPDKQKNADNIRKYSMMAGDHGVDIHALGVTNWNMLADSPIKYADSSSWVQYGMYGMMMFWNENNVFKNSEGELDYSCCAETFFFHDNVSKPRKPNRLYYEDLNLNHPLPQFVEKHLKCDWYDLINKKATDLRTMMNIYFFVKLQEEVTKYHKTKGWDFK